MKAAYFSMGYGILWLTVFLSSPRILASPQISRRLEPRQAAISNTSTANIEPAISGIVDAISAGVAGGKTASGNISSSAISSGSTNTADFDSAIADIIGAVGAGITAGINASSNNSSRANSSGSITIRSSTTSQSNIGDSTHVPIVNPPIVFPSFSKCTSGDTGTATFTSEFVHFTGSEFIADDQHFWNDTNAVWVVMIVSPGYSIQALGLNLDGVVDPQDTSAISLDSASSTFAITVPTHGCEISRPAISWSVEPSQTTSIVQSTYTLSISGEYPCASNTILNPPAAECSHNPAYALTPENWQSQNVDQLLYEWWFDASDDECDPLALGSSTLKNVQPPDTSKDLPSQLAYWAANLEAFDCTMGGDTCTISEDPCDSAGIPPWAFLALSAMMNLHSILLFIKDALANAILAGSLLSFTILDDFIHDGPTPEEKAILALTFIGALVGVLGIFWTLLIPAGVVGAIEEEAASIAEEAEEVAADAENSAQGLAAQAIGRLAEGVAKPKAAPGQGAAIYGSIPGALITGSASTWSKIVSDAADPLAQIESYDDLLELNWNQTLNTLINYNDNLLSNNSWAAMLMSAVYGGIYAKNHTEWSDAQLIEAMNVDVASRFINNIFAQKPVYVQFTDLGDDGNSTTKCEADLHGPQSSKYCADGGVYYLQSIGFTSRDKLATPFTEGPYGYGSLESVGIEPWWICAASAKLYRQYGFDMDYTDVYAFTDALSYMIGTNLGNAQTLIGQLPGEWSLPICDGGKNYYGQDYTTSNGNSSTGSESDQAVGSYRPHQWIPCACGYQGNETSLFYQAAGIWNLTWTEQEVLKDSCALTMTLNNNQGWVNMAGGPPPNNSIIDYSGYHDTLTIKYNATLLPPVPQNPPWYV